MTKQEKDQRNLKKNIIWLANNIDKYTEKVKRPNYLMCVKISCKPGTFEFSYGKDDVAEYNGKIKKLISHTIKSTKEKLSFKGN